MSFDLILDLCGLLTGKALPGDVDDDEGEDSTNDRPEKGKGKNPVKNKKKRKDKKSVVEIEDNPVREGQFRDPHIFII